MHGLLRGLPGTVPLQSLRAMFTRPRRRFLPQLKGRLGTKLGTTKNVEKQPPA